MYKRLFFRAEISSEIHDKVFFFLLIKHNTKKSFIKSIFWDSILKNIQIRAYSSFKG